MQPTTVSAMPKKGSRICALDDLPAVGGKEFIMPTEGKPLRLFILQHDHQVYAYINGCKHFTGTPLNPNGVGNFLHPNDATLIRCNVHGALYHITTGGCVQGECDGVGLDPVAIEIRDLQLFIG